MKIKTTTAILCKARNRPDAACSRLVHCRMCGRVLGFTWADRLCASCARLADAPPKAEVPNG